MIGVALELVISDSSMCGNEWLIALPAIEIGKISEATDSFKINRIFVNLTRPAMLTSVCNPNK
jgi:hypothetical protein